MNRRESLKTIAACAIVPTLPLSDIEEKQYFYAIVNNKKLLFKDVKIGDFAQIWNIHGYYWGSLKVTKSPYLKPINETFKEIMVWTLEGEEIFNNTRSSSLCSSGNEDYFEYRRNLNC